MEEHYKSKGTKYKSGDTIGRNVRDMTTVPATQICSAPGGSVGIIPTPFPLTILTRTNL